MNTRYFTFCTFILVVSLAAACSKKGQSDSEGPQLVEVNGVKAPDCVVLYRSLPEPSRPKGNCAMAYFDPACTTTNYGVTGAETHSNPGSGGCEKRQLIVAKDYKAAREQFGYPAAAQSMSKQQRKDEGYLPADLTGRRRNLPPGVPTK